MLVYLRVGNLVLGGNICRELHLRKKGVALNLIIFLIPHLNPAVLGGHGFSSWLVNFLRFKLSLIFLLSVPKSGDWGVSEE